MKLSRCSHCGILLPETAVCLICGRDTDLTEISLDPPEVRAAAAYARMQDGIAEGEWSQAIDESYEVLDWMPDRADVYWLRLLARKECRDAGELILKGFRTDLDPDYLNALHFSRGVEHDAYVQVGELMSWIRREMLKVLPAATHRLKVNTGIYHLQSEMQKEMKKRTDALFQLWRELQLTEYEIFGQATSEDLVMKEERDTLFGASEDADAMKKEIYAKEQISPADLNRYLVQMAGFELQSAQSKYVMDRQDTSGKISAEKQHPWTRAMVENTVRVQTQTQRIQAELASLKQYEEEVERALSHFRDVETQSRVAEMAAKICLFEDAIEKAELSKAEYHQILIAAGVRGGEHYGIY